MDLELDVTTQTNETILIQGDRVRQSFMFCLVPRLGWTPGRFEPHFYNVDRKANRRNARSKRLDAAGEKSGQKATRKGVRRQLRRLKDMYVK